MAEEFVSIPELSGRVVDTTESLTANEKSELNSISKNLEEKTGAQLAFLLISSTKPEEIDQFSLRVVEKWKLGEEKKDNGILVIFAKDDRKIRIEVGYGLEGVLTDVDSKRIIRNLIIPEFKQRNFFEGLKKGSTAIYEKLSGLPPSDYVESKSSSKKPGKSFPYLPLIVGLIIGIFIVEFMNFNLFFIGGIYGIGVFVFTMLQSFSTVISSAQYGFFGFIAFLISYLLVKSGFIPFPGGRMGGGSSWDSFSGGGGSFGGGGASGDWD
jgi:uncharacterized protein